MPDHIKTHRPTRLADALPQAKSHATRENNSHRRGYDRKWQRLRLWHLARQPLCVHCKAKQIATVATQVDHIIPFKGRPDPNRLDPKNLQSLCVPCHNKKTRGQNHDTRT